MNRVVVIGSLFDNSDIVFVSGVSILLFSDNYSVAYRISCYCHNDCHKEACKSKVALKLL